MTAKTPTHVTGDRDGIVFAKATTLSVWALLIGAAALLNLAFYAWKNFDLFLFDGPTPDEQATIGVYLTTWAFLFTAAATAFLFGARRHSQRHLTPWMALAALAVIHGLLGVPVLVAAFAADGQGHALSMLLLNPLTYLAPLPAIAVIFGRGNLSHLTAKATAGLLVVAVAFPFVFTVLLGH